MSKSPYQDLPARAFWRSAVAETGPLGLSGLWTSPWTLPSDAVFVTYGSCFAQHISRALVARQMNWLNAEPAPGRTPDELARKYNYGVFSARTGNIYTAAQMLTWARLASGLDPVSSVELWTDETGRTHDLLRPNIEPRGFVDATAARASVETTRRGFLRSVQDADVFVFTLGLTEGWTNLETGATYAICPGTSVGTFDAGVHAFRNYTYPEIIADLRAAFDLLRGINPALRILLTVSPVPLVASASGDHVLVATQYSKSVLRAVAGDLAQGADHIDYFPSYEIIAAPSGRAVFFEPNMRSVSPHGVDHVMTHFFGGLDLSGQARSRGPGEEAMEIERSEAEMAAEDLVCDEILLERFNGN
ncbi:GSCFA domain-containing protein [Chachezhania sediminis]|uniref:GSCFA domain-containing protein n=1 Tax=Chachezhania sediminis TaxID=2599291 RepID=UPI00131C0D15|nr:GSCFA domain-containing protein [Chachezhania sediminis]